MKKQNLLSKKEMSSITGGDSTTQNLNPVVDNCDGKHEGDVCSIVIDGVRHFGICRAFIAQPPHCSFLH